MSTKWRTLLLLALAELLAMSLWFSASAVTPILMTEWGLTSGQAAWLTMAVQIGFVVGAMTSAVFNLADLWPPRILFGAGALVGAACNAAIPLFADGLGSAVALRFGTGIALAAVYPVGMKIMATWTLEDRGLGIGLLVGALTLGSASPHLIRGLGGIDNWQFVMLTASGLATIAGAVVLGFGHLGPHQSAAPRFRWSYLARSVTDRSLRLANLGYLGHMWELYAMWTWIPVFMAHAYARSPAGSWATAFDPDRLASFAAFVVIGIGAISCLAAGRLADGWGRSRTTILSMAVSGSCALVIGVVGIGRPTLVTIIAIVWGLSVIADSAQFSTAVSELGEPEYMGTLLTSQTSMGFLLTLITIRIVPAIADTIGWEWAFAVLAVGPALGIVAMGQLSRLPEATRMAGGRG